MLSDKVIPPGGEGEIQVTFTVNRTRGKKTKSVTVHSNDPLNKLLVLRVQAFIEVDVDLDPNRIYFNQIQRGTEEIRRIKLVGTKAHDVHITELKLQDNAKITARLLNPANEPDGAVVEIVIPADIPVGRFFDRVTLTTDYEPQRTLVLTLHGQIVGDITVNPKSVQFGLHTKGEFPDRSVVVTITEGKSFKILSVKDPQGYVTSEITPQIPNQSYKVTMHVGDHFDERYFRGTLVLRTDHPDNQEILVQYYGGVRKEAPPQDSADTGKTGSATAPEN